MAEELEGFSVIGENEWKINLTKKVGETREDFQKRVFSAAKGHNEYWEEKIKREKESKRERGSAFDAIPPAEKKDFPPEDCSRV